MSNSNRPHAKCSSIVAAAGCGKTESIATAVAHAQGRQLILTHTNAGVDALRRRLNKYKSGKDAAGVDTIAGWSMKYVFSYPQLSAWSGGEDDTQAGWWNDLYKSMTLLIQSPVVRQILLASYTGAFVDEYQDCNYPQHALIKELGKLLPTQVLGDPLQAIFGFKDRLPNWEQEVTPAFPPLKSLTEPWRWKRPGYNLSLGTWLLTAREAFEKQLPLDLTDKRVEFVQTPSHKKWSDAVQKVAFDVAGRGETAVVIIKWPRDAHSVGRLTGGMFQCIEAVTAKDGLHLLNELSVAEAHERPHMLLTFIEQIANAPKDTFANATSILRGKTPTSATSEELRLSKTLLSLAGGGSPSVAALALEHLAKPKGVKIFRRELMWAVIDTLRNADEDGFQELDLKFRKHRKRMSHSGRRLSRCSVGSTLLVKGLEFDHAIVVATGEFTIKETYVAFTRGSKSLTIISPYSTLKPPA